MTFEEAILVAQLLCDDAAPAVSTES
jgi:hypothetical protein